MSPETLNPESKVGTLNLKTFESGKFCRVNAFPRIWTFFPYFEFAVELKWRIQQSKESEVVGVLMAIDGGHW